MKAEIVSTGTELLLGKSCNEDARILCELLARCGIDVYRYTTVGDNLRRISEAYSEALERSDIVISTGGLGGTDDDLSKQAASLATSVPLEENEKLESFLRDKKVKSERIVRSFSSIPKGAILFENTVGVAPGIVIPVGEKFLILLPGPPAELKSILKSGLEEFLRKLGNAYILNKVIKIHGFRESDVEDRIHDLTLSSNPTVATFLKKGWIEISITAKAKDKSSAFDMVADVESKILKRFPKDAIGKADMSLEETLYDVLKKRNLTISFAESVTGGMIASKLVNVSGISSIFMGSLVLYSNDSKMEILGLSKDKMKVYGAVSKECVTEMAKSVKKLFKTDISVATTGIAGPTGGTKEKPVGTVWFAFAYKDEIHSWKRTYAGNRNEIREYVTEEALDAVIRRVSR